LIETSIFSKLKCHSMVHVDHDVITGPDWNLQHSSYVLLLSAPKCAQEKVGCFLSFIFCKVTKTQYLKKVIMNEREGGSRPLESHSLSEHYHAKNHVNNSRLSPLNEITYLLHDDCNSSNHVHWCSLWCWPKCELVTALFFPSKIIFLIWLNF
jgi:hypothetical protein